MRPDKTDQVLADMDACLAEFPTVTCWKCGSAPGEPSICRPCKEKLPTYESPPPNIERIEWHG